MNSNTKALPPVTHAEAREILGRFNNSHFRSCKTGETARYSIPANPARDDDLRLLQYIKQCEAAADLLAALEAELEQAQQKISGLRAINNVNGDWTLRVSRLEQDNARLRVALENSNRIILQCPDAPYRDQQLAENAAALAVGGDQ